MLTKSITLAMFTWVRLVYGDGAVADFHGMVVETVQLCGGETRGTAYVRNAWEEFRLQYSAAFVNDGAPTPDPDTSGDELVIIEDYDLVFSGGDFEACAVYGDQP